MSESWLKTNEQDQREGHSMLESIKQRTGIRKVLVAGSGAVGKTSLLKVIKENKPLVNLIEDTGKYHRTLFFDMETVSVAQLLKKEASGVFQLVDIAGQLDSPIHALRDIPRTALGAVDVVILVFANDNVQSLIDLAKWVELLESYYSQQSSQDQPEYVLVRNKSDLKVAVDDGLVNALLDSDVGISHCFETSCVTGVGVTEIRDWLIERFFKTEKGR